MLKPNGGPSVCPSCTSYRLVRVGKIPASDLFAGRRLTRPLDGGYLYRCCDCHLSFRFPILPETEISTLYQEGSADAWVCEAARREDWKIANKWIGQLLRPGMSILDVGCFDGTFLESLGPVYRRLGVEMHRAACDRAIGKGVEIIASRYEELGGVSEKFDAIVSFDLIEHVSNPARLLSTLSKAVRPRGIVIVSSGNSRARTWRIMGSRYWYCAISEHVSFVNPKWCDFITPTVGLRVEHRQTFSHARAGFSQKLREAVRNCGYCVAPSATAWLRKRGFGGKNAQCYPVLAEHPPSWMSARDHFIFLGRKVHSATADMNVQCEAEDVGC
jgi:SAM-dependent methyltransferase